MGQAGPGSSARRDLRGGLLLAQNRSRQRAQLTHPRGTVTN